MEEEEEEEDDDDDDDELSDMTMNDDDDETGNDAADDDTTRRMLPPMTIFPAMTTILSILLFVLMLWSKRHLAFPELHMKPYTFASLFFSILPYVIL